MSDPRCLLQLDGFEGPMDLLLELARQQKVDLHRISMVALVEQYLAVVARAAVRLDLQADWLVMAAWLTWLKSRLLLPAEPEGEEMEAAALLTGRLEQLEAVRGLAQWLAARPSLGADVFARGMPETLVAVDRSELAADVPGLLRAYASARRRGGGRTALVPRRVPVWSVADALDRLRRMLGRAGRWTALEAFLPPLAAGAAGRRAALASTLLAGLEMAREGAADLRQEEAFGPIMLRGMEQAA